jgi:hypothetical protein
MRGLTIVEEVINSVVMVQPIIFIKILDHDNFGISPTCNHIYDVNYMVVGITWPPLALFGSIIEATIMINLGVGKDCSQLT